MLKKDTLFPNGDWILEFEKNADVKEFERKLASLVNNSANSSNGSSSGNSNNSNVTAMGVLGGSNASTSAVASSSAASSLRVKLIDPSNLDSLYTTKKLKLDNRTILFGNLSEKITPNELCYLFDGYHLADEPFRKINRSFIVNNSPHVAYFIKFASWREAKRAATERNVHIEGIKPCVHWYNI